MILSYLKRITPAPLRRLARLALRGSNYSTRTEQELTFFGEAHDLPPIAHYWSNKYLVPMLRPFGFTSGVECIQGYLAQLCRASTSSPEGMAEWLRRQGVNNFVFECLDVSESLVLRGKDHAAKLGLSERFSFNTFDVNHWRPQRSYDAVVAIQSLHHVVNLEQLFDSIKECLSDRGYFLVDDMIGRNGHQRWPEAVEIVCELWKKLPEKYKRNRQSGRLENEFVNFDCSKEGFGGIRAQDILPLLIERFHFECFFAFGNVIDVFIGSIIWSEFRGQFGVGYAIHRPRACARCVEPGRRDESSQIYKHFTPAFCVRGAIPVALGSHYVGDFGKLALASSHW